MDGQLVEADREEVDIPLGDDSVPSEETLTNGVPNGIDPERLEQLLLQVAELKKEQQHLREEQEGLVYNFIRNYMLLIFSFS